MLKESFFQTHPLESNARDEQTKCIPNPNFSLVWICPGAVRCYLHWEDSFGMQLAMIKKAQTAHQTFERNRQILMCVCGCVYCVYYVLYIYYIIYIILYIYILYIYIRWQMCPSMGSSFSPWFPNQTVLMDSAGSEIGLSQWPWPQLSLPGERFPLRLEGLEADWKPIGCEDSRFEVWLIDLMGLEVWGLDNPRGPKRIQPHDPVAHRVQIRERDQLLTDHCSVSYERPGEHPPRLDCLTSTIKLQCLPVHEKTGGFADVSLSAAIFNPHASTKIVFRTPEHASHHDEWLGLTLLFFTPSNHWHANNSENALYLCSWTFIKNLCWSDDQKTQSEKGLRTAAPMGEVTKEARAPRPLSRTATWPTCTICANPQWISGLILGKPWETMGKQWHENSDFDEIPINLSVFPYKSSHSYGNNWIPYK